jgi:hypothetical protein
MEKKLQLIGIYTEDVLFNILFNQFIDGLINNKELLPEIDDNYLKAYLSKLLTIDANNIVFKRKEYKDQPIIEIYFKN